MIYSAKAPFLEFSTEYFESLRRRGIYIDCSAFHGPLNKEKRFWPYTLGMIIIYICKTN